MKLLVVQFACGWGMVQQVLILIILAAAAATCYIMRGYGQQLELQTKVHTKVRNHGEGSY